MKSLLLSLFLLFSFAFTYAQVPEGYLVQYQQNFNDNKALTEFAFNDAHVWGIFKGKNSFYLQGIPNQSVLNRAIIDNKIFGDFILEADVMSVADSSGRMEIGFLLGYKDSTRFYYVQLANHCDSLTQGIFLMNGGKLNRIAACNNQEGALQDNKWHKIRLERNIVARTIRIFVDKSATPLFVAKDYEIVMGSVGFANMVGTIRIDNIKIWSQTVQEEWYK
jgi:hypothetical protein